MQISMRQKFWKLRISPIHPVPYELASVERNSRNASTWASDKATAPWLYLYIQNHIKDLSRVTNGMFSHVLR